MLYISLICFAEISFAEATATEHLNSIVYPDALYVSNQHISSTILGNGTIAYTSPLFIAPSSDAKQEQRGSHALAGNTAAIVTEENFPRKKSKKRHPFARGKDDTGYNPNFLRTRHFQLKIPP